MKILEVFKRFLADFGFYVLWIFFFTFRMFFMKFSTVFTRFSTVFIILWPCLRYFHLFIAISVTCTKIFNNFHDFPTIFKVYICTDFYQILGHFSNICKHFHDFLTKLIIYLLNDENFNNFQNVNLYNLKCFRSKKSSAYLIKFFYSKNVPKNFPDPQP